MKSKLSKFFNNSYRILCGVLFFTFLIVVLLIIDNYKSLSALDGLSIPTSSFIVFFGALIYILFLVFLYRRLDKLTEKKHNIIAIIITVLSFIILVSWGLSHKVMFTYDLSHIVDEVLFLLKNNSHKVGNYQYFSKYPLQVPLFVLIYFISGVGKTLFNSPENTMIIYNCLMTSITFYFVYQILKELFNSKIALIGMIILALYPDFYLFASYYYTDITAIPFTIIGIYCLIKADKNKKIKKYLLLILGGILFAIASKLRVVSSFLLIAYVINTILKGKYQESIKKIPLILVSFLAIYLVYSSLVLPYFKIDLDKTKQTPSTHWLMMGLNNETNGFYNWQDDEYTLNSKNKVEDNIDVIKERIRKVNLDFWLNKMEIVWAYGSGAIQYYKNVNPIDKTYPFLVNYNSIYINYLARIMKLAIYFLLVIILGNEIIKKIPISNNKISTFIIAIFGGVLFYTLWEGHYRYCFSFLPWIVLASTNSIPIIDKALKVKTISIDKNKIDFSKIKKYIGYMIIVAFSILIYDNYIEYAVKHNYLEIVRVNQDDKSARINIIDNTIKQKFKIKDDFDKITVTFIDNHIKEPIPYIFELYDDKNKLIYKNEFMATEKQVEIPIDFKLKNVKVNKEKTYYFKVYSNEATIDNYLQIRAHQIDNCANKELTSKNQGYDAYPEGDTYSDDKLLCAEATYTVYDNKYQNKISKKIYLPVAFVIYGITILSVYICLLKKQ